MTSTNLTNLFPDRLQTVDEFAELTGTVPLTIYRAVKRGEIPSYRIGRAIRINPAEALPQMRTGAPTVEVQ